MAIACPRRLLTRHVVRRDAFSSLRPFSCSCVVLSGHNRWSKIKHEKGKADDRKNKLRTAASKDLTYASRMHGDNPNHPRIALAIANAKKVDFPKASIEAALARGQGLSVDGAALESFLFETVLPPSVPILIDCQTDNKNRTIKDVRVIIKNHQGTLKPTLFSFDRRGRIQLEKDARGVNDVLDELIEAGAEDVEEDENGGIVIFTEPSATTSTAAAITQSTNLIVRSADLVYQNKADIQTKLGSDEEVKALIDFLTDVQQDPAVQNVYANVGKTDLVDKELWDDLEDRLAA